MGVPVGAVDEGGEVGGFCSLEGVAVGGDVKFVGSPSPYRYHERLIQGQPWLFES